MGILQQECRQPKAVRNRLQQRLKEIGFPKGMDTEEWNLLLVAGLSASLENASCVILGQH